MKMLRLMLIWITLHYLQEQWQYVGQTPEAFNQQALR